MSRSDLPRITQLSSGGPVLRSQTPAVRSLVSRILQDGAMEAALNWMLGELGPRFESLLMM